MTVWTVDGRRRHKAATTGFPLETFVGLDELVAPEIRGELTSLLPPALSPADAVTAFWQAWFYVSEVDRTAERDLWVRYARAVGWAGRDGQTAPGAPLRLYRGAPEVTARGLNWTPDKAIAAEFARLSYSPGTTVLRGPVVYDPATAAQHARAGRGIVWTTVAPPEAVLGVQREPVGDGRGNVASTYDEYLVVVDELAVTPFAVAAGAGATAAPNRAATAAPNRAARRAERRAGRRGPA